MASMAEGKIKRHGKGKSGLAMIHIEKADDGGHMVTHHFHSGEDGYQEPKKHVFGKQDGGEMLAHIGEALGIPNSKEEAGEPEHEMGAKEKE